MNWSQIAWNVGSFGGKMVIGATLMALAILWDGSQLLGKGVVFFAQAVAATRR